MIRLLLAAAVTGAILASSAAAATPGPWRVVSVHKHAGPVTAVLSIERRKEATFGGYAYRKLALVVENGSKTVFSRSLCTPDRCSPGSQHTLKLQNVWGGPPAEAVVDLYTGGAHCCFESLVVLGNGPQAGRLLFHQWGDPGYRGQRYAGTFDLITADDRFAYEFTSFAGSALPTEVWAINPSGRFVDVTSTRLDLVRADARRDWHAYVSQRGKPDTDLRGVVAAWCADEYRLGLAKACDTELASALPKGYLSGPPEWPKNAAFITALKKSLRTWGY